MHVRAIIGVVACVVKQSLALHQWSACRSARRYLHIDKDIFESRSAFFSRSQTK